MNKTPKLIWMVFEGNSEVYYRVRWEDGKLIPESYSNLHREWLHYKWDLTRGFWDSDSDVLVTEMKE